MKKEVIVSAPTLDEAINKAAAELNVDKIDCSIEILETPKRAMLFSKAKDAVIKATVEIEEPKAAAPSVYTEQREQREPRKEVQRTTTTTPRGDAPRMEAPKGERVIRQKPAAAICIEKVEISMAYLKSILTAMGLENVTMEVTDEDEGATISFNGEGMAVLIGHHGETLDALQYLVALTCNRADGEYYRISLDCGSYRDKREVTLQGLAGRIADKVKKTGRSQLLEPMNPYERRIIHAIVSEIEGVYSRSKGEEPNRRVVILSETPSKGGYNNNNSNNSNRSEAWQGNKPQGSRPQSGRPQGSRPQGDRPQGSRPQGDRPQGSRPQGDRPQGSRPQGDRFKSNKPQNGGYQNRDKEFKPSNQHQPERSMEDILKSDFKKREESAELYSKIEL